MTITIRRFIKEDIPYKVKWINNPDNNKYLHYELPLKEDKTLIWFNTLNGRKDRVDYTILFNGEPAGLIGLLNIDNKKKNAEYYICLGGNQFKGKGIAREATKLVLKEAYSEFELVEVYLYTEYENTVAQKSFEKSGFYKKKLIKNDLFYNGKYVDRYLYTFNLSDIEI